MIIITQHKSPAFWQIYLDSFPNITIADILTLKWYFLFSYIAIVLFDRLQSIHLDDENVIRHIFDLKTRAASQAEIRERVRRGLPPIPVLVLTDFPLVEPVPAVPVPAVPVPAVPVPAAPVPGAAGAAGTEAAS